jgi:hypothetical protein
MWLRSGQVTVSHRQLRNDSGTRRRGPSRVVDRSRPATYGSLIPRGRFPVGVGGRRASPAAAFHGWKAVSGVGGLSSNEVLLDGVVSQGWWLVVGDEEGPGRVVAGPFPDRTEAGLTAALDAHGADDGGHPVYGIRRADGTVRRRPAPEEWAWLAHLGTQLDRLPEEWDAELDEDDPFITLVVEVAAALAEAGLPLHDSAGTGRETGGACLTPEAELGGVVVTWRQHDRMSVDQVHGGEADAAVQQVMNRALADLLALRGFDVEAFGGASGHVVRLAHPHG